MDKVNILLVDDQPAKLLAYEVILEELGENLIKANSPHEALGILLKTEVAVVLIDVVMPQIDGFQLAAMIREHPRFQKLAMIFVSGVQIAETDHLRGYEIGAVDYVTVPVVPEVLRAKVRVFIELFRKTRQLEAMNAELEKRVAARTAELEAQTEKLRQSEERRSIALSAGDMGSWEVDLTTGHIEWDDGPYRIFDVDPKTFHPTVERIEAMMHPEDRDRNSVTAIVATGEPRFQVEFRIVRPSGEVRWCYGAGIISHDADGKPVRMNGVTVDVTDRKRAEERQLLLAREVDHRAKNMLAVVLSVLRLTKAKTTADFISTVEGRIHALAATHNLLSATRWQGANLRQIVDEELAPYRADHRERVTADGPAAMLLPATAQAVALALHELATNAAKYGALSTDTGKLQAHLVDRHRRARGRMAGDRRTAGRAALVAGLRPLDRALQHRGAVPRRRPLRLAAGGPVLPAAHSARADRQSRAGAAEDRARRESDRQRPRAQPVRQAAADGRGRIPGRHDGQEAARGSAAPPCSAPTRGSPTASRPPRTERFDGALLDFNLAGELAEPLADFLIAHGVPFIFLTGYQRDSIDRRYANVPLLQKPIEPESLERVLVSLLDSPAALHAVDAN